MRTARGHGCRLVLRAFVRSYRWCLVLAQRHEDTKLGQPLHVSSQTRLVDAVE